MDWATQFIDGDKNSIPFFPAPDYAAGMLREQSSNNYELRIINYELFWHPHFDLGIHQPYCLVLIGTFPEITIVLGIGDWM